jgi:hypothetical protein
MGTYRARQANAYMIFKTNETAHYLFLFLLPLLPGCSLIGASIGEEVDKSIIGDNEKAHKYESQYMVEGLEEDIKIIE